MPTLLFLAGLPRPRLGGGVSAAKEVPPRLTVVVVATLAGSGACRQRQKDKMVLENTDYYQTGQNQIFFYFKPMQPGQNCIYFFPQYVTIYLQEYSTLQLYDEHQGQPYIFSTKL